MVISDVLLLSVYPWFSISGFKLLFKLLSVLALSGSTHYLTCFTKTFLKAAILNKRHLSFLQYNLMWFSNDHELLKAVNYCCTVFTCIYSGWSRLSTPAGYETWTVKKLSSKSPMTDHWNSSFNTSFLMHNCLSCFLYYLSTTIFDNSPFPQQRLHSHLCPWIMRYASMQSAILFVLTAHSLICPAPYC